MHGVEPTGWPDVGARLAPWMHRALVSADQRLAGNDAAAKRDDRCGCRGDSTGRALAWVASHYSDDPTIADVDEWGDARGSVRYQHFGPGVGVG